MTDAPAKKVELSKQQQLENMLFGLGAAGAMVAAAWWYVGLCWHTRRKHNRFAGPPVCIELFGSNPVQGQEILFDYGIRSAFGSLQWAVIENKVALRFMFLVSKASFDYADCILDAYQGETFYILTNPGSKRGQALRRPYAQRKPSQPKHQRSAPKRAKLGRTYKAR
jgi:hypothetical protein